MEAIASPYRQLGGSGWRNEAEIEPEICPPPPPRIQSRMSIHAPKPPSSNNSTTPTEVEAWPLPPQPPQEDRVKRQIEPWPLPPVAIPQSTQCKSEDITCVSSPHQIESPYVSQSPGRVTPVDQAEAMKFSTVLCDDDKRRTLTSMMEPLSVSPSTSSITISQSDTNDESQSTAYDDDIFDTDLRNFVQRIRRSNDIEPPMPPPRMQSRAMSEMGLWHAYYRHEFDDENSTISDWTTSTLPCKGKKSPEARPWLAPPLHRDILANEFDLSQIPSRLVGDRPWLAPPHQDRLTPEGASYIPHLPPHHGRRTPVAQLSRSASINDEGPIVEEYLMPESVCQCDDRMRVGTRYSKSNQKSYIRCMSSPPPLPPHKNGVTSPMRQLSLPVGPPLPPHKEHMTPSEGSLTLPRRTRSKYRYQDCVQLREKDSKDGAFSASAKNIFRRCKSGILAHTRRSTEIADTTRQQNRRSTQPVISRSDKTSLKTQSSDNSSFHEQVKELVNSVDLGECFIM